MSNILVINVAGGATRVALIEAGILAELYVEREHEKGIVGNIYRGKVVRVLPGMQAAFVDIGTDRAAFLYVSDVLNEHIPFSLDAEDADEFDEDGHLHENDTSSKDRPRRSKRGHKVAARIEDQLREGQEILVQAAKNPIGTKGARITSHISLPGRHLVFMPTVDHIGISRRITSERERRRLRNLVDEIRPEGSGFIVRTAAEKEPTEHLRGDMKFLIRLWQDILARRDQVSAPALLQADLDLVLRATRDLVTNNVSKIIVDSRRDYERIPDFIRTFMPGFECEVELYSGREPMFNAFGIEIEIERALKRTVPLKSGASLVIDQTEALTAIDVNTGKYVGKTNLENTITAINLEAADEIVYQLRLRNIGGLIIIDFIDMISRANRERVNRALITALKVDKQRSNILKISDFGLVEMTRKRVQENLLQQLCEPCPYCDGRGTIKAESTMAYLILRRIRHMLDGEGAKQIEVHAHKKIIDFVKKVEFATIRDWEAQYDASIHLASSTKQHLESFDVSTKKTN